MAKEKKGKEDEVLTAGDSNEGSPIETKEETQDVQVNEVGGEAVTDEKPDEPTIEASNEEKTSDGIVIEGVEEETDSLSVDELHTFVKFLAARTVGPAEMESMKQSFPRIFND